MGSILSILREYFYHWSYNNTNDIDTDIGTKKVDAASTAGSRQNPLSQNLVDTDPFSSGRMQTVDTDSKKLKNVDIKPISNEISDTRNFISDAQKNAWDKLNAMLDKQMTEETENLAKFKVNLYTNPDLRDNIVGMTLRLIVNSGNDGLTSDYICNYVNMIKADDYRRFFQEDSMMDSPDLSPGNSPWDTNRTNRTFSHQRSFDRKFW